jgi:hypothetical protein
MSEETRRLWNLVKVKLLPDALRDIARYFPEISKEAEIFAEVHDAVDEGVE